MAPRLLAILPRHRHYVEAYAGGCALLLARDPDDRRLWLPPAEGVSEVVNDLDGELINFWKCLQEEHAFRMFRRWAQATPLSRQLWDEAGRYPEHWPRWRKAAAFFVRSRQSLAGRGTCFTALTRSRLRRGVNGNASEWLGAVDGLDAVHARLAPVVIENMPAVKLIHREDGPGVLFYLDPPYLHSTRTTTGEYAFEMDEDGHRELLDTVIGCTGHVMLSGYPSALYDKALAGWNRHDFNLANHAAAGKSKRRMTECVWCNF